ncbi:MAG: hypothetical protein EBW63_03040, partial [Proteobacteria bacterium]|nr:hypothetical protein [Pseudomonadota bacterium]
TRVNQSVYSGIVVNPSGLFYLRTGAIMAYYTRAENFPIFHPSTPGTENVFYARLIGTDQPNFYVPNYIGYVIQNYAGPGGQYLRIQELFTPIYRNLSNYTGPGGGYYITMKAEDIGYGDLNYTRNRDIQFVGSLNYLATLSGQAYYARTFPAGFFYFDNSQGFYTGPPTLKYLGPGWAQYQKTYTRTGLTVLFEKLRYDKKFLQQRDYYFKHYVGAPTPFIPLQVRIKFTMQQFMH